MARPSESLSGQQVRPLRRFSCKGEGRLQTRFGKPSGPASWLLSPVHAA